MIDLCAIRTLHTALKKFDADLKAKTGLSFNDALCLCSLNRGISEPGQLAREITLSPSRLTRILDALESRGLIRRTTASDDRRTAKVELTARGKKTITEYSCADIQVPDELKHTQEAL